MHRRFWVRASVLVVLVAFGACRQAELQLPTDYSASITTDHERYIPKVGEDEIGEFLLYTIGVSYTNTTAASVYLDPCSASSPLPEYELEHYAGGTWQFNYSPMCRTGPGPGPAAVELEPGESFSGTYLLNVYTGESFGDPLLGTNIHIGVNRLALQLVSSVDDAGIATAELLPLEQRLSNAFVLEAP